MQPGGGIDQGSLCCHVLGRQGLPMEEVARSPSSWVPFVLCFFFSTARSPCDFALSLSLSVAFCLRVLVRLEFPSKRKSFPFKVCSRHSTQARPVWATPDINATVQKLSHNQQASQLKFNETPSQPGAT